MKATIKILLLILIFNGTINSQNDFVPGYYIINSTAKYAVALPSGLDYSYDIDTKCYRQYSNLRMGSGEVVIAFEYSKGKLYCFDPNGRMVAFEGLNSLTKAPMTPGAGVGHMDETINLIDGTKIEKGSYYWITGQNTANSTITIQVADGKSFEIPQSKITLYGLFIKSLIKEQIFKAVED